MELNDIITIVNEKATDIATQEISNYIKKYPEINLGPDSKNAVKIRATSQLTLQISKFKFNKDDEEFEKHFIEWFEKNEEEDLRKTCRHCLDDEANKIRHSADQNLTSLDAYLKKHLGDIHQID